VASANLGPGIASITVLEHGAEWQGRHWTASPPLAGGFEDGEWRGVSHGIVFSGEHEVFISEGASGRVAAIDLETGERRHTIDLNRGGYTGSVTGALALDSKRHILYVTDETNSRVVALDSRDRRTLGSARVGYLPFAMTLAPDTQTLYVTNAGMFRYQPLGGNGLDFLPFGFPSEEARLGVRRETADGSIVVPGLGDPNSEAANSICVIDVSQPAMPKLRAFVRTGLPFGESSYSGSSPSGIVATDDRVYVSNAANDSITVIDRKTNRATAEITLRIPGLEALRGIVPAGLAFDRETGWLFVAEAGINAVGVIDAHAATVLGHIPAGWFPAAVQVRQNTLFTANLMGEGSAPKGAPVSGRGNFPTRGLLAGSVSISPIPSKASLAGMTRFVSHAAGFQPEPEPQRRMPAGINHVVLIVKSGRSFDEVLGDTNRPGAAVMADPKLAHFGRQGYADGEGKRLSLHGIDVTPNTHAIADRWSFSDNFYVDSDSRPLGQRSLAGVYPLPRTIAALLINPAVSPFVSVSAQPEDWAEGGSLWTHLARHGVSFLNFGLGLELAGANGATYHSNVPLAMPLYAHTSRAFPGYNPQITDTERAARFIKEIDGRFAKGSDELPQFVSIYIPDDALSDSGAPSDYPYSESYIADNDLALGRIVEYLSHSKWWNSMVVFITEDSNRGPDHIDAHRTLLLCAGPWAKRGSVMHTNESIPGLLHTIFALLHIAPLNLFDASAGSLSGCFGTDPVFSSYSAQPANSALLPSPR